MLSSQAKAQQWNKHWLILKILKPSNDVKAYTRSLMTRHLSVATKWGRLESFERWNRLCQSTQSAVRRSDQKFVRKEEEARSCSEYSFRQLVKFKGNLANRSSVTSGLNSTTAGYQRANLQWSAAEAHPSLHFCSGGYDQMPSHTICWRTSWGS